MSTTNKNSILLVAIVAVLLVGGVLLANYGKTDSTKQEGCSATGTCTMMHAAQSNVAQQVKACPAAMAMTASLDNSVCAAANSACEGQKECPEDCTKPCCAESCPPDCTKPCCAESCPPDCTKPCCQEDAQSSGCGSGSCCSQESSVEETI